MIHNPIIPGFNPDPSITFDGEKYIIAVSTFEYYPGVALYSSRDLSKWTYECSVMTEDNGFALHGVKNSSGIYAPTIRYHNGRYYMVTTNKGSNGNFIVHSASLKGPWCEALYIYETGIDPSIVFLDDGSCFYTQNGPGGIYGAFIDPDGGKLLEPLTKISSGITGNATEAPHIYAKDGYYYLVFAEGGTEYGHHASVGRSRDIHGPYELLSAPILSHADRKGHVIQATGHADLLKLADGRWIAVFLAIRMPGRAHLHNLGRETMMAEVEWKDGWPCIGKNGFVELDEISEIETEKTEKKMIKPGDCIDNLPLLRVRARHGEFYSVDGDILTIHGSSKLSEPFGEPAALLFRQEDFGCEFSAELCTGNAGGITVFYNSDYHADLFARNHTLVFRRRIHDLETEEEVAEINKDTVRLSIKADREWYRFYADGKEVGKAAMASFATEGTMYMTFTGTLIGVFSEEGDAKFRLPLGFCSN